MDDILRVVFARREGSDTTNAFLAGQPGVLGAIGSLRQYENERTEREGREQAQTQLAQTRSVLDTAVRRWKGLEAGAPVAAADRDAFAKALEVKDDIRPILVVQAPDHAPPAGISPVYVARIGEVQSLLDDAIRMANGNDAGTAVSDERRRGFLDSKPTLVIQTDETAVSTGDDAALSPHTRQFAEEFRRAWQQIAEPSPPATINDAAVDWAREMSVLLIVAENAHAQEAEDAGSDAEADFMKWLAKRTQ